MKSLQTNIAGIACDFKGFPDRKKKKMIAASGKEIRFDPEKPFVLEQTITLGADNYQGCLLQLGVRRKLAPRLDPGVL